MEKIYQLSFKDRCIVPLVETKNDIIWKNLDGFVDDQGRLNIIEFN